MTDKFYFDTQGFSNKLKNQCLELKIFNPRVINWNILFKETLDLEDIFLNNLNSNIDEFYRYDTDGKFDYINKYVSLYKNDILKIWFPFLLGYEEDDEFFWIDEIIFTFIDYKP